VHNLINAAKVGALRQFEQHYVPAHCVETRSCEPLTVSHFSCMPVLLVTWHYCYCWYNTLVATERCSCTPLIFVFVLSVSLMPCSYKSSIFSICYSNCTWWLHAADFRPCSIPDSTTFESRHEQCPQQHAVVHLVVTFYTVCLKSTELAVELILLVQAAHWAYTMSVYTY
jgi:hypothetical protein